MEEKEIKLFFTVENEIDENFGVGRTNDFAADGRDFRLRLRRTMIFHRLKKMSEP